MNDLAVHLADYRPYHSEFQIVEFIVGQEAFNLYGAYRQCQRELYARFVAAASENDLQDVCVSELANPSVGALVRGWGKELHRKDRIREMKVLLRLANALRRELCNSRESVEEMESEYWKGRLANAPRISLWKIYAEEPRVVENVLEMSVSAAKQLCVEKLEDHNGH